MSMKAKQELYRRVFSSKDGKEILADLNCFCYGTKSIESDNQIKMAVNEGRRQVLLDILAIMKVETLEEVFDEFLEF